MTIHTKEYTQTENLKINSWLQTLKRKGFIDEKINITEKGKQILSFQILPVSNTNEQNGRVRKNSKITEINKDFEKWWEVYPPTNNFEWKGKKFIGTQKKNIKKEECKKKFGELVLSGKFTAEDIINATLNHINIAKEESYKLNDNKLTYIPNSERYLREKYFEPFITKTPKKESRDNNIVDI